MMAKLIGFNEFLAAFSAGVTLSATAPPVAECFRPTGKVLAETLKLAAVLLFGALLSSQFANAPTAGEWILAITAVFFARPLALAPSLLTTSLGWRERLTVAWFGPKGFASIFFGVLILSSGFPGAHEVFRLIVLTVAISVVAHSSTDVPIAKWLDRTANRVA
jgi:sodium/hydrogen antiporter